MQPVTSHTSEKLSDEGRRRLQAHLAHELAMHDWLLNASENKGPSAGLANESVCLLRSCLRCARHVRRSERRLLPDPRGRRARAARRHVAAGSAVAAPSRASASAATGPRETRAHIAQT